jgi:KDO2-lipid IV(A) lauroyltransferase
MGKSKRPSPTEKLNKNNKGDLDEIPEGGLGDIMAVIGGFVKAYTRLRMYKLFSIIPRQFALAFWGHFMGRLIWRIAVKIRKNDIRSIQAMFKNMPYPKARNISLRAWIMMGYAFFHTLMVDIPNWTPENIDEHAIFKGLEHVDEALKRGKGVIIASTHFGHIQALYLATALKGYKVNIIANVRVSGPLVALKAVPNLRCIPTGRKQDLNAMLHRVLKENQLLFVFADFSQRKQMGVKFMGRLAHTPAGIPSLAKETGAAIIPAYTYPNSYKTHVIKFMPEYHLQDNPEWSKKEFLGNNLLELNNLQTWIIRKRPELYFERITYAIERTYLRKEKLENADSKEVVEHAIILLRNVILTTFEKGRNDAQYYDILDDMLTKLEGIPKKALSSKRFTIRIQADWRRVRDTMIQVLLNIKDMGVDPPVTEVLDYGLQKFIILPKVG